MWKIPQASPTRFEASDLPNIRQAPYPLTQLVGQSVWEKRDNEIFQARAEEPWSILLPDHEVLYQSSKRGRSRSTSGFSLLSYVQSEGSRPQLPVARPTCLARATKELLGIGKGSLTTSDARQMCCYDTCEWSCA